MGYLDSSVNIKDERVWVDSLKTSQRKEAKDECWRNGSRNALGGTRPSNVAHMPNRAYLQKLQL